MNNSGDSTHKARAVPPIDFRNQATGIGQQLSASRATGSVRNAIVSSSIPEHCRAAVPVAEGFMLPATIAAGADL